MDLISRTKNMYMEHSSLITFFIILMIVVILIIIVITIPSKEPRCVDDQQKHPIREKYTNTTDFKIYNYLNKSISIDLHDSTLNKTYTIMAEIKPRSTGGFVQAAVIRFLRPGNMLKFYIFNPGKMEEKIHYADYVIDTEKDERIKALHVGMVTARFLGSTDTFREVVTNANAGQGQPWLKIHNLTNIPLKLNQHIAVEPHQVNRYQGYLHMGVPLGTYFKDDQGLYPDYQYLKPNSDLFYGVTSDLQQSLDGCWQLEFSDRCDYGQTLFPMQEGIY